MKTHILSNKKNVEKYEIRIPETSSYWADIIVDDYGGEKYGRIYIISDYDSSGWSYFWSGCGVPFKQFLTQLDIEYTAGKFGQNKHFDLEKTLLAMEQDIDNAGLTPEEKHRCQSEIRELKNSSSNDEFIQLFYECAIDYKALVGYPTVCTGITPLFKRFWEEVWPVFIETIKAEILSATIKTNYYVR